MADVRIRVNGQTYSLQCGDGEEARVEALGAYLDAQVREVGDKLGQLGEVRLLLLASLNIADELFTAREKADNGSDETVEAFLADAAARIEALTKKAGGGQRQEP